MSHSDVITRWPTIADFASDIRVRYETAKGMRRRGAIPPGYWVRVVAAANMRGIDGVTYEWLAELVAIPLEAAE